VETDTPATSWMPLSASVPLSPICDDHTYPPAPLLV